MKCPADDCRNPGPFATHRAYTVHIKNCLAMKVRLSGLKRRREEFMEKKDRQAEERERAVRQVAYMLSNPMVEVRNGDLCLRTQTCDALLQLRMR